MESPPPRLDGWKAIGGYLGRDERTAQRWRERGLPVYVVPGGKRATVFAFAAEIDHWLRLQVAETSSPRPLNRVVRAEVTRSGLVAWKADGHVAFSVSDADLISRDLAASGVSEIAADCPPAIADFDGDGAAEVCVALRYVRNERITSDEVRCYSATGHLRWRYQPAHRLRFGARTFDGPWAVSDRIVVPETDGRSRLVIAVNHETWWPSLVASLDANGTERLHLVHAGRLHALHQAMPSGSTIFVAGVNVEYASAALMLIDLDAAPAVSPQQRGDFVCAECAGRVLGPATPTYALFPPSELSAVFGRPYNVGTQLAVSATDVQLLIEEVPEGTRAGPLFSHYRLSTALEPVSTWMSDAYWAVHHRLEARGEIGHSVANCPDHTARQVRIRTATGWRDVLVPVETGGIE